MSLLEFHFGFDNKQNINLVWILIGGTSESNSYKKTYALIEYYTSKLKISNITDSVPITINPLILDINIIKDECKNGKKFLARDINENYCVIYFSENNDVLMYRNLDNFETLKINNIIIKLLYDNCIG